MAQRRRLSRSRKEVHRHEPGDDIALQSRFRDFSAQYKYRSRLYSSCFGWAIALVTSLICVYLQYQLKHQLCDMTKSEYSICILAHRNVATTLPAIYRAVALQVQAINLHIQLKDEEKETIGLIERDITHSVASKEGIMDPSQWEDILPPDSRFRSPTLSPHPTSFSFSTSARTPQAQAPLTYTPPQHRGAGAFTDAHQLFPARSLEEHAKAAKKMLQSSIDEFNHRIVSDEGHIPFSTFLDEMASNPDFTHSYRYSHVIVTEDEDGCKATERSQQVQLARQRKILEEYVCVRKYFVSSGEETEVYVYGSRTARAYVYERLQSMRDKRYSLSHGINAHATAMQSSPVPLPTDEEILFHFFMHTADLICKHSAFSRTLVHVKGTKSSLDPQFPLHFLLSPAPPNAFAVRYMDETYNTKENMNVFEGIAVFLFIMGEQDLKPFLLTVSQLKHQTKFPGTLFITEQYR